jgi:multisubunit Na+/H+ antiporter MnhB subunit
MLEGLLDITLALLLLCMAWGALFGPSLSAAIGHFVAFGLVLSLIWARLGSADLAFAEAAIGAGLTGVLLLRAARGKRLHRVGGKSTLDETISALDLKQFPARISAILYLFLITALLTVSIYRDGFSPVHQQALVPELLVNNLDVSGVAHPVTAVLLNFRAWDTLLELLVLLLALLGTRHLYPFSSAYSKSSEQALPEAWPLMQEWTRLLAPLLVLTGGYILWRGESAPGGAFQAGALLAAAAIILRLTGLLPPLRWSFWPIRFLVCIGALLFISIAALTAWLGQGWLSYPPAQTKNLIIIIELAATLSIAATLTLLVVGEREDLQS